VYNPTKEEVEASTNSGLLPKDSGTDLPIRCFLPLSHPVAREDKRISGPMWIGPMGDKDVMASMTVERSLELCGAIYSENDLANWSQKNVELENRKIARAVRNIAEESEAIETTHLVPVDELSSWLERGGPPSPARMAELLNQAGYTSSVSHYAEPAFRSEAPWSEIVRVFDEISATDI